MSEEVKILVFIVMCLGVAYVGLVGHILIKCLKTKQTTSLEGENQDVIR